MFRTKKGKRRAVVVLVLLILLIVVAAYLRHQSSKTYPLLENAKQLAITAIEIRTDESGRSIKLSQEEIDAHSAALLSYLSTCQKRASFARDYGSVGSEVDIVIRLRLDGEPYRVELGAKNRVCTVRGARVYQLVEAEQVKATIYAQLNLERLALPW